MSNNQCSMHMLTVYRIGLLKILDMNNVILKGDMDMRKKKKCDNLTAQQEYVSLSKDTNIRDFVIDLFNNRNQYISVKRNADGTISLNQCY